MSPSDTSSTVNTVEPSAIAMAWVKCVIKKIEVALLTKATSIDLDQPFLVVYNKDKWIPALRQANAICEAAEEYEICSKIQKLQEQVVEQIKYPV